MFEKVETNSERWFNLKPLEYEEWRPLKVLKKGKIYDYDGYYEISNYGRVKSMGKYHGKTNRFFNEQHIIKAKINKDGYLLYRVSILGKGNYITAHRAVATTFISNVDNLPQINHIDGNKKNNCIDNLEWCTASQNVKHAYSNGLKFSSGMSMPKEQNPNSKYTQKQIDEIRDKRARGYKLKELSKEYGSNEGYISRICNHKFWK